MKSLSTLIVAFFIAVTIMAQQTMVIPEVSKQIPEKYAIGKSPYVLRNYRSSQQIDSFKKLYRNKLAVDVLKLRLDSVVIQEWVDDENGLANQSKTEFGFDENGRLKLYANYIWMPFFQWVGVFKYENFLNADGSSDEIIYYDWNYARNKWELGTKNKNTYDGSGSKNVSTVYKWNVTIQEWVESSKSESYYDSMGKDTLEIDYKWNGNMNKWIFETRNKYSFDQTGKESLRIKYVWNESLNNWIENKKTEHSYNTDGIDWRNVDYDWDTQLNKWVEKSKWEISTVGNEQNSTNYDWNVTLNKWVGSYKFMSISNAKGDVESDYYYQWDVTLQQWTGTYKNKYEYDSNDNNVLETFYIQNPTTKEWENLTKIEYQYDNNHNILNEIEYNWNSGTQVWEESTKEDNNFNYAYSMNDILFNYFVGSYNNMITNSNSYKYENGILNLTEKTTYYYSEQDIVSIDNKVVMPGISIYPNPVLGGFYIANLEGEAHVSLCDLTGKMVVQKVIVGNEYIAIDLLQQGIYLVKITTNNGVYEHKLVKK